MSMWRTSESACVYCVSILNIALVLASVVNLNYSTRISTCLEGDRKANIDVLEANKNVNKEEIRKYRDENSLLRTKLAQLQRVR